MFEIPKRSPDLSVMDYAIWPEVNRRMRLQGKGPGRAQRQRAKGAAGVCVGVGAMPLTVGCSVVGR